MAKRSPPKVTYVSMSGDPSLDPKFEAAAKRFRSGAGGRHPMFIGGEKVWSSAGEFESKSPIDTSIIVGKFQIGTRSDAKAAIEAALTGFEEWRDTPWQRRVEALEEFARLVDERKFDIAAAIAYEVGKNRLEALAECWEAVDAVRYCAELMRKEEGYSTKMGEGGPGEHTTVVCKPYGAWPVISPFNFPFMLANGMALGALMTGNSVVLKPTSAAPLTGLMLYAAYVDAGVPAGVVNYVTGPGGNFEDEFATNKDVAGIAFTGSRDVGMKLYRRFHAEQRYPKPMLLEMGSKNPTIVMASADVPKAVEGTVRAAFGYGGQKCSATSRLFVQEPINDEFLDALGERTRRLAVGNPIEKRTFMGPLINAAAVSKFEASVAEAKRSGGRVLVGGDVMKSGSLAKGFYVSPTVITHLPLSHRLFRDELFLPIIVAGKFKTIEEAIRLANDTDYGLTAGIFTEKKPEMKEFFERIRFGVTYANRSGGATTGAWPGAQSFTGWNASGFTGRGVGGPHYLLNFLRDQSQTVVA